MNTFLILSLLSLYGMPITSKILKPNMRWQHQVNNWNSNSGAYFKDDPENFNRQAEMQFSGRPEKIRHANIAPFKSRDLKAFPSLLPEQETRQKQLVTLPSHVNKMKISGQSQQQKEQGIKDDVPLNEVVHNVFDELKELDGILKIKRKRSKASSDHRTLLHYLPSSKIVTSTLALTGATSNSDLHPTSRTEATHHPPIHNKAAFSNIVKTIASRMKLEPLLLGVFLGINGAVLIFLLVWALVYLYNHLEETTSVFPISRQRDFIRRDTQPPSNWDILFRKSEETTHPPLRDIICQTPVKDLETLDVSLNDNNSSNSRLS